MKSYINNTRFDSIITVNIESVGDVDKTLEISEIGNKNVWTVLPAGLGIHDVHVPAGKELRPNVNTVMTFVAIRNAPH